MNEFLYKELIRIIEGMISDNVLLIHGGQIIHWEDTKVIEILKEIKKNSENDVTNIIFRDN